MTLEQLVPSHDGADRQQVSGKQRGGAAKRGETCSRISLRRAGVWGVIAAAGSALAFGVSPAAAKSCGKHAGAAKKACTAQLARDRQAWPKNPKAWEIRRRVGNYNWHKAHRVAVCETGKRLDWYPHGRYRGPLGMYRTTQDYGKRATGYWSPRTWQEHVAIAVAAHPITRGWSGWGCGGA